MSVLGRFEKLLEGGAGTQNDAAENIAEPRGREHLIELAEVLATTERLRALLQDGFADRDRGFEYVLARLPNASPDRARADRAESALAERTVQLAEALVAAWVRSDAFAEALGDRDLRFALLEAQFQTRLGAETRRQEEVRDEIRRVADRLDERSVHLAEALIAMERNLTTVYEALRVSGEALAALRARLEMDRRAAIRPPNLVRRFARGLKRAVPPPFERVARAALRRLSRR